MEVVSARSSARYCRTGCSERANFDALARPCIGRRGRVLERRVGGPARGRSRSSRTPATKTTAQLLKPSVADIPNRSRLLQRIPAPLRNTSAFGQLARASGGVLNGVPPRRPAGTGSRRPVRPDVRGSHLCSWPGRARVGQAQTRSQLRAMRMPQV
jgi:hypothetical protein